MVDMSNVWDRTTEFLGDNAGALLPIVLVAMLLPNTVNTLVGSAGPAVSSTIVQVIALACALIAMWGQLAVIALAFDPDGGRPRATSTATRSFGRGAAAMLILFAAILVLALPILALLAAGGVTPRVLFVGGMAAVDGFHNIRPALVTSIAIYSIVLTVLILFVAVRLAMLYPVIVAEGGVVRAIQRAWALSRGIVWKMIGVWLLFGIVYGVAAAAVTSGIGTVIGFFADMRDGFSVGRIMVAILSGVVSTLFTLIVAAFSAKLYRAAIAAREGVAPA